MATIIEVRNRIQSVKNTQKITNAMKIVAATKLKKNEKRQRAFKPYAAEIEGLLREMAIYKRPDSHPLMVPRGEVKRVGFLVIASDRGLCGAFNSNLLRKADLVFDEEKAKKRDVVVYALGTKALRYYESTGDEIIYSKIGIDKEDKREVAKALIEKVTQDFLSGEIDELKLVYNGFRSTAKFDFEVKTFLPACLEGSKREDVEPLYEESYQRVMDLALPLYLENVLLSAIYQSTAAEEASRMMAMDYATENTKTLINELTLFYNRTRQAVITRELAEIVGGAEALKKS